MPAFSSNAIGSDHGRRSRAMRCALASATDRTGGSSCCLPPSPEGERAGGGFAHKAGHRGHQERQLSVHTLIAYRSTWLKLLAAAAAEGLVLKTLPKDRGVCSTRRRLA